MSHSAVAAGAGRRQQDRRQQHTVTHTYIIRGTDARALARCCRRGPLLRSPAPAWPLASAAFGGRPPTAHPSDARAAKKAGPCPPPPPRDGDSSDRTARARPSVPIRPCAQCARGSPQVARNAPQKQRHSALRWEGRSPQRRSQGSRTRPRRLSRRTYPSDRPLRRPRTPHEQPWPRRRILLLSTAAAVSPKGSSDTPSRRRLVRRGGGT